MLRRIGLTLALVTGMFCLAGDAQAQQIVSGHYRHNHYGGYSYVQPHYRSYADGNFYNNWSTYPNINPHTGAIGTHHRPSYGYGNSYGSSYSTPSYSSWSYWNW